MKALVLTFVSATGMPTSASSFSLARRHPFSAILSPFILFFRFPVSNSAKLPCRPTALFPLPFLFVLFLFFVLFLTPGFLNFYSFPVLAIRSRTVGRLGRLIVCVCFYCASYCVHQELELKEDNKFSSLCILSRERTSRTNFMKNNWTLRCINEIRVTILLHYLGKIENCFSRETHLRNKSIVTLRFCSE